MPFPIFGEGDLAALPRAVMSQVGKTEPPPEVHLGGGFTRDQLI
jgi:hypothetical protein